MFGRTKIAMLVAEFLGAATLASVVLATSKSGVGFSLFLAMAAGVTFGLLALMFSSASGAHFNPAITLGLWTVRKIRTGQAAAYLVAQMLGGLAAWGLMTYLTNETLKNVAGKNFDWRVLIAEVVGAFLLTMAVTAALDRRLDGLTLAATVGGGLFLGILVASVASNGLVNPAVALGLQSWSKAYVIGPLVGGILGPNFYTLFFASDSNLRTAWPGLLTGVRGSRSAASKPASRAKAPAKRRRR